MKRIFLSLFLGMICAAPSGCQQEAVPVSMDDQVLRQLDYYEPMYRLNESGRVISIRMDAELVPDFVMALLGKLTELKNLHFYAASLNEDSLVHLHGLKELRSLDLRYTQVSDKVLAHLDMLDSLRYLWLPAGRLSPALVEKWKDAHPDVQVWVQ